mgnify:CR=1 FL=1
MKIKEYKNDKGLTVQQLADKAGISKRTLEDIMRCDDVLILIALETFMMKIRMVF